MALYEIRIRSLDQIRPDRDNITNAALFTFADEAREPNDPNNLVVKPGDQVRWRPEFSGATITYIIFGRRRNEVNTTPTASVFEYAVDHDDSAYPPPLHTIDGKRLDLNHYANPSNTPPTIKDVSHAIGFSYRIYLKERDGTRWWIDPEFDVCP